VSDDVLYAPVGRTAWITINRPESGNGLTSATYSLLAETFHRAEADASVGVVVLTGAGDTHFSGGGDTSHHRTRTPNNLRLHLGKLAEVSMVMRNMGKPIIAAVNGRAIGGGHQLQLLCDISIASDRAILGQDGTRRAAAPFFWGLQLLSHYVGEKKAREICILSREYSADEALRMGIVTEVVPHDSLREAVQAWANHLLELDPSALRAMKTALNQPTDIHYPALFQGREMLAVFAGTDEWKVGNAAYGTGVPPDWSEYRI
jgi:1,4-dihydroxy-2-naphthoyl-CoA synthase